MQNLHRGICLFILCVSLFISSCSSSKSTFGRVFQPNCKLYGVGSACFHNPSGKTIRVDMKGHKMEILPYSTICIDLYEGEYEYKAKMPGDKWRGRMRIIRCKEKEIELIECIHC